MLKLGVNTVLFKKYDVATALKAIKLAGYDGAELSCIQGMCEHLVLDAWQTQAPLVRALGGVHRAAEQLGGVAAGVHPGIRILATEQNRAQREAIESLRTRLLAVVAFGVFAGLFFLIWLARRRSLRGLNTQ